MGEDEISDNDANAMVENPWEGMEGDTLERSERWDGGRAGDVLVERGLQQPMDGMG